MAELSSVYDDENRALCCRCLMSFLVLVGARKQGRHAADRPTPFSPSDDKTSILQYKKEVLILSYRP